MVCLNCYNSRNVKSMNFWKGTMFVQLQWLCCRVSPIFLHSVPDICAQPLWSQWTASLIFLHNLINVITVSYIFAQTDQSSCTAHQSPWTASISLHSLINLPEQLHQSPAEPHHSIINLSAQPYQYACTIPVSNLFVLHSGKYDKEVSVSASGSEET